MAFIEGCPRIRGGGCPHIRGGLYRGVPPVCMGAVKGSSVIDMLAMLTRGNILSLETHDHIVL